MCRFEEGRDSSEEGASLPRASFTIRFADLIEAHEQAAKQDGYFTALTDTADRLALAERIQDYLTAIDVDSRIAGFRVLAPMDNGFESSVLLSIWDNDDNTLALADERVFDCSGDAVLTNLVFSFDDEACFSQPLMNKGTLDRLLREHAKSSKPDVPRHFPNLLHGVLLQEFRDFAQSIYGFYPAEFRVFWRSPFKHFNVRGAFGLAIATPYWSRELREAHFLVSAP